MAQGYNINNGIRRFDNKFIILVTTKPTVMLLKQVIRPLKYTMLLSTLFIANITLKSQESGEGSMKQFYIVSIVFTVLIVGGVLSFFISNKKKRD